MTVVERTTILPYPPEEVYAWHSRPGALERLTPPWEPVTVTSREGTIEAGRVTLRVSLGPVHTKWVVQHHDGIPGREFRDRQEHGPFERWEHLHRFEPEGAGCRMTDRVEFRLPAHNVTRALAAGTVSHRIERALRYRHDTLGTDLATHENAPAPLRIAITGATGLVGTSLSAFLTTGGHTVLPVTRRDPGPGQVGWAPRHGRIEAGKLEGVDAVVHLAGENIAGHRWDAETKRRIMESRRQGTLLLAESLSRLDRPPRVLVSASAVDFYGDSGDRILTEDDPPGGGFLSDVAEAWEEAADPARRAGIRVVHPRIAMVLTPAGGALERLLIPFSLGAGGNLGGGEQWMSWISIDDLIYAIHHAITTLSLEGSVNAAAPGAVTNAEFTRILGRILHRPTVIPVPAGALRLVLGEMADPLLLSSKRVTPAALERSGFTFRHPDLETALRHVLGRF